MHWPKPWRMKLAEIMEYILKCVRLTTGYLMYATTIAILLAIFLIVVMPIVYARNDLSMLLLVCVCS